jgi:hypothetical protein
MQRAEFSTAIKSAEVTESKKDPLICVVSVQYSSSSVVTKSSHIYPATDKWVPITIPLDHAQGKTIKIDFSASSKNPNSTQSAIFRYPLIDVDLSNIKEFFPKTPQVIPSNTDLSSSFPALTNHDFVFPPLTSEKWTASTYRLLPADAQRSAKKEVIPSSYPSATITGLSTEEVNNYSHFYFKMSADQDVPSRSLKALVRLNDGSMGWITLPLLGDNAEHGYTYDFKILELHPRAKIKEITIFPVDKTKHIPAIQINEIRLIHR